MNRSSSILTTNMPTNTTTTTMTSVSSSNNNNNNIQNESSGDSLLETLPMEIIENILKYLNQRELSITCRVSKSWNRIIYLLWHTIDLSKSHHHFTHLSSKLKQSLQKVKKNKIGYLQAIFQNLVNNNGFFIPPLVTNPDSYSNSNKVSSTASSANANGSGSINPAIFQKNIVQQQSTAKRIQQEIQDRLEKRIENFFQTLCFRHHRIEVLDLSGCSDLKMDSLLLMVQTFSQTLQKLMTRRCKSNTMTDMAFSEIFQYLPKLKTLAIGEMPMVGEISIGAMIHHCPLIDALGLGQCQGMNDDSIIALSKSSQAKSLHTIGLNNLSSLGDHCIRELGTHAPNLVIFSVNNIRSLTSDTLSTIFLNCSLMGSIDLSGCMQTDDSVLVSISKSCTQLFQFNISRIQKITSYSINLVIRKCKNLRILLLSKTMVDDDCVLSMIDNLNLETLYAPGCTGITDVSVQSFLNLGPERLSKMFINFSQCLHISQSLISILQSLTKSSLSPTNNHAFMEITPSQDSDLESTK
ncbi:hypothetical protein DLAC_01190 [Tieghemostelium lacteum]|uniref:F-box domain-containing protein n=1 Tax=Tieghemostelium lacteum TaxID=361077 RepID=A0A152A809_TIELA|nr:hypothetical protein DLAC_01190 [Tieghemostelium lacteum]|eukprot:KYR02356.1 hypothetical protein DLAC_01190 [Tieghemostelium lacteum]